MIDALKKNIQTEIDILKEISIYVNKRDSASETEKKQIDSAVEALKKSLYSINESLPKILSNLDQEKKIPSNNKETGLEKVSFKRVDGEINVTLEKKQRDAFIKELDISENLIRKLRGGEKIKQEKIEEFKASRGYLKFANKFFLDKSSEYINKGYFKQLYVQLKKANMDMLLETYISMMILTTIISIGVGILLTIFFMFFNIGMDFPFITLFEGNYLIRFLKVIWILPAVPIGTFYFLYFYPATERSGLATRIDTELPFAVVHMSAISGSGISPAEIFKIIGGSNEYPHLKKEIRKVLNQTNIYGYDLVTAVTNVSKTTPSNKLSELFTGIATTINSGGSLSEFFEKRAETLLMGYRLDREKFTRTAETFMDIYISVAIAAPMILMLLLVLIFLTGIDTGFPASILNILIISAIALINVLFLVFLHLKQPAY